MPSGRRPRQNLLRLALAAASFAAFVGMAEAQDAADAIAPIPSAAATGNLPDLPGAATPSGAARTPAKPVSRPKPKPKRDALPPLRPYPGAERLGLRGGAVDPTVDETGAPLTDEPPPPAIAALPNPDTPPPRRKLEVDADPYAPLGLRLGDITVKPYVEEDAGYATNPLGVSSGAKGSMLSTTEAGADWQSDWSRDDFHGQLKAGYNDYASAPSADGAYGSGVAGARVDATRDLSFDAEGRFNVAPQSFSSFGLTAANGASPYVSVATYGATVGVVDKLGDLSLGLHGSYDHEAYQNVALFGASAQGLSADDYDDWGAKFRASYRISEAVSPFLEFGLDTRRYPDVTDALGYQRDSVGYLGDAGVTLNWSKLLTGEASIGYGERDYQDPRLPRAAAPLVNASLVWSPTALTTVTLKTQTALEDSVLAGASADLNRTYTIDIAHSLTRAVTLGLTGSYATDDFLGATTRDSTTSLAAHAEYHVNRHIVLKASATRQIFASNQAGQGYVGDVFLLGVKLQE
ncbi:MAG: outer membrane beta-barrel protein [Roseiarcus sp.]